MKRVVGNTLIVLGVLVPLVPLLVWSVSARWRYPSLAPQEGTLRGLRLLADPGADVLPGLVTSLTIGALVTIAALVVGTPAGRALGLYTFRGRRLVQFVLLAPAIVPGLAVVLGTQVLFIRYGLSDTVPGVVLVQLIPTVPYVTLVMAGAFANYDSTYEQQARVLGAGPLRAFFAVTVPVLRPALLVSAFFAFLISWSEYVLTLLVGGGAVKTLPLLLFAYARGSDLTQAAAVALLLVTPPLLIVAAISRHLGARSGGVVGVGRL